MKLWYSALVICILLLFGCERSEPASRYIGKWVDVNNDRVSIEIVRNGDAYIVRRTMPKVTRNNLKTDTIPAIYKDGLLQVQLGGKSIPMLIDERTGNLVDGKYELKRAD